MSKQAGLVMEGVEIPFNAERWGKLPALPGALALDLFHAKQFTDVSVERLEGWKAWWETASDPWGRLFAAKDIRKLDQHHRSIAEVGLGIKLHRRRMSDPPLPDGGVLMRVVGVQWKEGLDDVLSRLPLEDMPRCRGLLAQALLHSVKMKAIHSQQWLVQWLDANDISLAGLVSASDLSTLWQGWSKTAKLGHDHPLYAKSARVLSVVPGSPEETELWNGLVKADFRTHSHEGLAAWCHLHPGAWERLHALSLRDPDVKNAWLLACRRACRLGESDALWQEAVASASSGSWMQQFWKADRAPLVAWLADAIDHGQVKGDPSDHFVFRKLMAMGAPAPGSAKERLMGGASLVECLPSYGIDAPLARKHPEWIAPNPVSGRTPLFDCESWHDARKYIELGLSWTSRDPGGVSAFASFIEKFSPSLRDGKLFFKEARPLFAAGVLPVIADRGVIAAGVARQADEPLFAAFLAARAQAEPLPSPEETLGVARHGSLDMLTSWKALCELRGGWTREHAQAANRGRLLCRHVPLFDAVQDDPRDPAWAWLLRQRSEYVDMRAIRRLASGEFCPMEAQHLAWEEPVVARAWLDFVSQAEDEDLPLLAVRSAGESWWLARLDEVKTTKGDYLIRKILPQLLGVGMPLESPAVIDAIVALAGSDLDRLPAAFGAAAQARELSRAVRSTVSDRPRHRL